VKSVLLQGLVDCRCRRRLPITTTTVQSTANCSTTLCHHTRKLSLRPTAVPLSRRPAPQQLPRDRATTPTCLRRRTTFLAYTKLIRTGCSNSRLHRPITIIRRLDHIITLRQCQQPADSLMYRLLQHAGTLYRHTVRNVYHKLTYLLVITSLRSGFLNYATHATHATQRAVACQG